MTSSATMTTPATSTGCPAWCAYQDCTDYHMSETLDVPAAAPGEPPVTATVFGDDDGTTISLAAGAFCFLPALTVDAARELARFILEVTGEA